MTNGIYKQRAKDIMSKDVVTVHPQDTVHDALKLMVENRVSSLPVADRRNRCLGMVSSSDFIELTKEMDDEFDGLLEGPSGEISLVKTLVDETTHGRIDEVMSEDVASVDPEMLLSKVAALMLRNRIHRVPVLDKDDCILGIISTTDILAAFVDSADE